MLKPIAIATAICRTLDIIAAIVMTLIYGRQVDGMLIYVASGPFPPATGWGGSGAALGLVGFLSQLTFHILLVGIPMALIAAAFLKPSAARA